MERKVKIEMPGRYTVGVRALVKVGGTALGDIAKTIVGVLGNGIEFGKDAEEEFEANGSAVVSNPMIHSIAEMKMECLNGAFRRLFHGPWHCSPLLYISSI